MTTGGNRLTAALQRVRSAFVTVAIFSMAVNVLMLTGPLYMLQIYDRVMTSGSVPTLVAISMLAAGLYAMLGLFSFLRSRVLSRVGAWLDEALGNDLLRLWVVRSAAQGGRGEGQPLADLGLLRQYMTSPAFMALFDLPWFPVYLAILFFFHAYLGYLALVGAVIVVGLALLNMLMTRRPMALAGLLERRATAFADQGVRNAEAVLAMGMLGNLEQEWRRRHREGLGQLQRAQERGEAFSGLTRAFRLLLQSLLLGVGAWLALRHEISPGSIIAGSIIGGRALAPLDQAVAGWTQTVRARETYRRLKRLLGTVRASSGRSVARLPDPKGHVQVNRVKKYAPDGGLDEDGHRRVLLKDVTFELQPGDGLGVIGPSASGKTTLARLLTGVWLPDSGSVRLDGATLEQWDRTALGRFIGYLPQSHELIAGTVAQNIARFDPEAEDEEIVQAAILAGVHEMILRLPDGYATQVGPAGAHLSAGQRQRVALARAVFRQPRLVVLDEPNANLDNEGDQALTQTILRLRESGSTVVVMTHRPSAIAAVDRILVLDGGRQLVIGPKAEVLQQIARAAAE